MAGVSDASAHHHNRSCDIALIAVQNDLFRQGWPREILGGRFVMTPAITERPGEFQIACLNAVRSYDAFSADTDPRGMHEMGVLEIQGEIVWFKIDLLDERYEHASPDPADTEKTRRVLTIQFPEER